MCKIQVDRAFDSAQDEHEIPTTIYYDKAGAKWRQRPLRATRLHSAYRFNAAAQNLQSEL
jgi:hypothetical protein